MKGERPLPRMHDPIPDPAAGGWGRAALGGGGSGQPWDAGPAPISAPSSPCSAPRAGVLHPTRPRGARPPLPQWDPALRLRRLRQNLRPLREPGAAHARPLPGGHLAEHGAPVRPPALRSSQGAQGAPRATQMGGALTICLCRLGLPFPLCKRLSPWWTQEASRTPGPGGISGQHEVCDALRWPRPQGGAGVLTSEALDLEPCSQT